MDAELSNIEDAVDAIGKLRRAVGNYTRSDRGRIFEYLSDRVVHDNSTKNATLGALIDLMPEQTS